MTDSFKNKFWHHRVHERLQETLYYYFGSIRPLIYSETREKLGSMLAKESLGTVRVFPIFGSYDLIIRAWLHPKTEDIFLTKLQSSMPGFTTDAPFRVKSVEKRWYDSTVDRGLLESLTEEQIRQVQTGKAKSLEDQFVKGHLILERSATNDPMVSFFVAINLDKADVEIVDEVVDELKGWFAGRPQFKHVSIYKGYGFCRVLLKAQVREYFHIAELPNWVAVRFKAHHAWTQTYLAHGFEPIAGGEGISEATFYGLAGTDLFVQWVVPEIYVDHYPREKVQQIEQFVRDEIKGVQLVPADRALLDKYLLGVLRDDDSAMAQTLALFFFNIELYLRKTHAKFISLRLNIPLADVYAAVKLEKGKTLGLYDLLTIYSYVFNNIPDLSPDIHKLLSNSQEFARLRNIYAHLTEDLLENWRLHLRVLIPWIPKLRTLMRLVQEVTSIEYREMQAIK